MAEESSNPNIEWNKNKKGFGATEKNSRKTDLKKALEYEATAKKVLDTKISVKPDQLPKGLKKIRKKIKDVYDEEDEEEYLFNMPLDIDNSLYNALNENEKKQVKQQKIINDSKMQQTVGKMEAIMQADLMAKKAGLTGINKKLVNETTADATLVHNPLEKVLSKELSNKVKTGGKVLSSKETVTMLRGVEKIKNVALAADESQLKALENMKVEEVINAGEKSTDEREIAKMILKKSGRKDKKDINKIAEKSKQLAKENQPQKTKTDKKKDVKDIRNLSAKDIYRD